MKRKEHKKDQNADNGYPLLGEVLAVLKEYQNASAEFAGTNSCISTERQAGLFLKHRLIFQELQKKYSKVGKHLA